MNEKRQIVAERAGSSLIAGTATGWIGVGLCVFLLLWDRSGTTFHTILYLVMLVLTFSLAVYMTVLLVVTPRVLIEYEEGVLYCRPKKRKSIAVDVGSIDYVSHQYGGRRFGSGTSGSVAIEYGGNLLVISNVKDAENARYFIEKLVKSEKERAEER